MLYLISFGSFEKANGPCLQLGVSVSSSLAEPTDHVPLKSIKLFECDIVKQMSRCQTSVIMVVNLGEETSKTEVAETVVVHRSLSWSSSMTCRRRLVFYKSHVIIWFMRS